MPERPNWKQRGGRLPKQGYPDLGMLPGKKAQAPDPEKLLEEFRNLSAPPEKLDLENNLHFRHKRSRRRRH